MCIDPGGHKGARPDQILRAAATWLVAAPCGGCIIAADAPGRAEVSCPRVMPLKSGGSCAGWSKGAGLLRLIKISIKIHWVSGEGTESKSRTYCVPGFYVTQLLSADTGFVGKGAI